MSMLRRDFVLLSPVDVGPTKCGQVEFQTGEGYGFNSFRIVLCGVKIDTPSGYYAHFR
jgi:hypothetical protein